MRLILLAIAALAAPALAQPTPEQRVAAAEAQVDGLFTRSDANGDGLLSAAEWQAAGRTDQAFLMMDANGDRQVTRAEARLAIDKVMEEPNVKPEP
jgi:hypothetical protein